MGKAFPAPVLALIALAFFSSFAAAQESPCNIVGTQQYGQCADFITCVIPEKNVIQGALAIYPITVSNAYGAYPLSVSLGAVCDPANLECVFANVPYPNNVPPGEYRTYDFYVYTQKASPAGYSIPLRVTASRPGYECSEDAVLALTVNPNVTEPVPQDIGVYATMYPSSASARPGESVKFFITLRNVLREKTFATISSAGTNPFEATTRYGYVDVQLNPEETKVVEVEVTIPPGTPGMVADWTFLVRTGACCYRDVVLPVRLVVHGPQMTLTLTGEPLPGECLEAKYGEPVSLRIGVRNDGEVNGPYSFSLEATEAAKKFAFIVPRELEITPGDRKFVNITIAPRVETGFGTYYYSFIGKYVNYAVFRRDYCVRVSASENVSVSKEDAYDVVRAATNTLSFSIKNTGSAACNFSLEAPPVPEMTLKLVPDNFVLVPNEEKGIDFVIGTTLSTPLEDYSIPVTLRSAAASCNITKEIQFALAVVSSNKPGESFLDVAGRDFSAVEGVSTTYQVAVSNNGPVTLKQVRLEVLGFPLEWIQVSSPRDIPAGASRSFDLTFKPARAGDYSITLAAVSGRESVQVDSGLSVAPAEKKIDFSTVSEVPVQEAGATRETRLALAVKNTGNIPATNIQPLLFSSESDELLLETQPSTLSLEPGQTATIQIIVKPLASAETREHQAQLKLGSAEGASDLETIKLPAMLGAAAKPPAPEFPWKIIAIIILLVLIFAILAREEVEKRSK